MNDAPGNDAGAEPGAGALWPEIAVHVEIGGLVPRWCASSVHPEFGPVSGRGLSHEAAVRALVRGIRRSRRDEVRPGALTGGARDAHPG